MPAILRKHGLPFAEFEVVEGQLGKTVTLLMRRDGKVVELLAISAVGDQLVYSSMGNQQVLGLSTERTEHDGRKKPS